MYLGIDLGTSGVKVVLVNQAGDIVRTAQESYPTESRYPGWASQNPADWWKATINAVQSATRHYTETIVGIGVAGQMHGLVLVDKAGNPVRPAIIWMDRRSTAYVSEAGKNPVWREVGMNTLSPGFAAASLLWLREHQPEALQQAYLILSPKDWLRYQLTGVFSSEPSDASGTLLMDVKQRVWNRDLLDAVGVPFAMMPRISDSARVVGVLTSTAATALGLSSPDVRVVAGAADQAAMLVGSGAVRTGQAVMTIGTGGQLSVVTAEPQPDPRLNTFCHAERKRYYSMGAILAAGYALSWWQKIVNNYLDAMLSEAEIIPAGAERLIFLPFLNGERTPHMNPALNARFIGLNGRHTQAHMTRAVLEGVAFAMRDCLETLREAGADPGRIILGGGGAQGDLWPSIFASVFDMPLTLLAKNEATAYGAAMLAAVGCDQFSDMSGAAYAWVKTAGEVEPRKEWSEVYQSRYNAYRELAKSADAG